MNQFVRRKNLKLIIILVTILGFVSIGYALISTKLNITGVTKIKNAKWDVHFENIIVKDGSVTPTTAATIENDTAISFSIDLTKPKDYYEFTVDVVNNGTIDAMIGTIIKEPILTPPQEKYLTYEVKYNGVINLHEKDSLPVGDKKTLRIFLKYREDINKENLPTDLDTLTINYQIDYVQADETAVPVVLGDRATTKIENLFTEDASSNGLAKDDTTDQNIRYVGTSPKNYVLFNNEKWRIIGIFNTRNKDGIEAQRVKLVRNDLLPQTESNNILEASWDSSEDDGINGHGNSGYGINQWGPIINEDGTIKYEGSDMYKLLNGYYLNEQINGETMSCKYCIASNQAICEQACSFNKLDDTAKNMIEEVVWDIGAMEYASTITALSAYQQERGTTTGKICEGTTFENGKYCNDQIERKTKWQGKVGLIYPSDYGYAGECTDIRNESCKTNNWLYKENNFYWTLSPYSDFDYANLAWLVKRGYIGTGHAYGTFGIRPSIYLNSNVIIMSGDGTEDSPYQLSA